MATTYTENYNLGKQENHADKFSMDVITENMDKIDTALSDLAEGVDSLSPVLAELTDRGAKNLFDFDTGQTSTNRGVTFTSNGDGTWSITGTSTEAYAYCDIYNGALVGVPGDTLVYSLNATGGTGARLLVRYYDSTDTQLQSNNVTTDAVESTVPVGAVRMSVRYDIPAAGTVLDVTTKPMICSKAAWGVSQAAVPYAPTNRELYEMILALQSGRSVQSLANAAQPTDLGWEGDVM